MRKAVDWAVGIARPARVFLFAVHAPGTLHKKVEAYLAAEGWTQTRREQARGADLFVLDPPR